MYTVVGESIEQRRLTEAVLHPDFLVVVLSRRVAAKALVRWTPIRLVMVVRRSRSVSNVGEDE